MTVVFICLLAQEHEPCSEATFNAVRAGSVSFVDKLLLPAFVSVDGGEVSSAERFTAGTS